MNNIEHVNMFTRVYFTTMLKKEFYKNKAIQSTERKYSHRLI